MPITFPAPCTHDARIRPHIAPSICRAQACDYLVRVRIPGLWACRAPAQHSLLSSLSACQAYRRNRTPFRRKTTPFFWTKTSFPPGLQDRAAALTGGHFKPDRHRFFRNGLAEAVFSSKNRFSGDHQTRRFPRPPPFPAVNGKGKTTTVKPLPAKSGRPFLSSPVSPVSFTPLFQPESLAAVQSVFFQPVHLFVRQQYLD